VGTYADNFVKIYLKVVFTGKTQLRTFVISDTFLISSIVYDFTWSLTTGCVWIIKHCCQLFTSELKIIYKYFAFLYNRLSIIYYLRLLSMITDTTEFPKTCYRLIIVVQSVTDGIDRDHRWHSGVSISRQ